MTAILFCIIQITIIATVAWGLSKILMHKMPELSAKLSLVGIVISAITFLATVVDIPRPIALQSMKEISTTEAVISEKQVGISNSRTTTTPPSIHVISVDLTKLTDNVKQIPVSNVVDEKQLMNVFGLCASILFSIVLLRFLIGLVAVWRLKKTSQFCDDPQVQRQLESWSGQHGLRSSVQVFTNQRLASPCVTWLNPSIIFMPSGFTQWTTDERSTALAHELAHIIRADAKYRMLAEFCFMLTCFHPGIYFLKRQVAFGQEAATDRKATELLSDLTQYLKGLSMLTLRMDSQNSQSFIAIGVSISTNNMIRRIKMLSTKKQSLPRWQEWTILSTLIIGCFLVLACSTSATEPEKQVAITNFKSKSASTTPFQRGKSRPWENVGAGEGYFRSLPQVMKDEEYCQSVLNSILSALIVRDLANPSQMSKFHELLLQNMILLEAGIGVQIDELPEKQRQGNEPGQWQFGSFGLKCSFEKEIDCKELAEHINWPLMGSPETTAVMKKNLERLGHSKEIGYVSSQFTSDGNELHSEETRFIKAVWEKIDGGALGLAFRIQNNMKSDIVPAKNEHSDDELDWHPIAYACEAVGLGIDRLDHGSESHFQLVLVLKGGQTAKKVQQHVKLVLANISKLADQQAAKVKTTREKQYNKKFRSALSSIKIDIENLAGTDYQAIVVRGVLSDILLKFE